MGFHHIELIANQSQRAIANSWGPSILKTISIILTQKVITQQASVERTILLNFSEPTSIVSTSEAAMDLLKRTINTCNNARSFYAPILTNWWNLMVRLNGQLTRNACTIVRPSPRFTADNLVSGMRILIWRLAILYKLGSSCHYFCLIVIEIGFASNTTSITGL